jgi:hypothetical protein
MTKYISEYPEFDVHWKTWHGELKALFVAYTRIRGNPTQFEPYIYLDEDGRLELTPGYVWDFASGPAVDTPDMVAASLVHDAFYELMKRDLFPWDRRKQVDKLFVAMLKEFGMPWYRRLWVYLGVRWGYPIWSRFGKEKANVQQ